MRILFVLFAMAMQSGCVTLGVDYSIGKNYTVSARSNLKTLELNLKR